MRRAYKYRIYPNKTVQRELEATLETHRRLYNECLEYRILAWETLGDSLTFYEQRKWFSRVRNAGHPHFSRINANSGFATIERLDKSYQNFFRRVKQGKAKAGFPRFKGKDRFNSIPFGTYPNGLKLIEKDGRHYIKAQYIGTVLVTYHRPHQGRIKTASLKQEADKWYVVLSCELADVAVQPRCGPPVGVDVGIASFLTTSDDRRVENPRYLQTSLPELRRLGRSASRKKKGGSNRRKAVRKLAKCHARIKDQRRDHHYRTAKQLVARYGLIAVEDLDIQGMIRDGRLNRAIHDVAWGDFLGRLEHKAEEAGVQFVRVDPRWTTQLCHACGTEVHKELSDRWHACPKCGVSMHRCENSAREILRRALQGRNGPAGANPDGGPDRPRNTPSPDGPSQPTAGSRDSVATRKKRTRKPERQT